MEKKYHVVYKHLDKWLYRRCWVSYIEALEAVSQLYKEGKLYVNVILAQD